MISLFALSFSISLSSLLVIIFNVLCIVLSASAPLRSDFSDITSSIIVILCFLRIISY